ncbi:helical backbone metal receptor [Bacillus sp. B15-48]|uniref:helical backbone metal receptor n=1 Tax=Bacillus sp. B15-48 TaxID=1548601 RepID=UPI00193FDFED|nr:helical backbone metal receptor [Bacillus sp. B15-48]MBM4763694.1 hypothetical protein [Bacillus sp. B15-48]
MVVGKDTYIQSVLERMGFINPFSNLNGRYPVVTEEDFQKADLDYVFLASEPYPFKEQHQSEFTAMMPNVKVVNVEGEMFWYGSHMLLAASYFKNLVESLEG